MGHWFLFKKCRLISGSILFVFFILNSIQCNNRLQDNSLNHNDIKVLVLIIASDDLPVYVELQKIWKSYMNIDREHVEVYFIKSNPNLIELCQIDGDTIWSRSIENYIPGIINKTILSMEFLLPRIKKEFDYVIRTNLSSFYVFPRLLDFLKNCPRVKFYSGINGGICASGCGMTISSDIVEKMVLEKKYFLDNIATYDDVLIGKFLHNKGISVVSPKRMDFYNRKEWDNQKHAIPNDIFHFRVKNLEPIRLSDDIYIHSNLLRMFYS